MTRSEAPKESESSSYFFRFVAETRMTFSNWAKHQKYEQKGVKNIYPDDKAEIMIFDKRIEKDGFFHHYGLGFDVKIEAVDQEVGQTKSEVLVLNLISTLCFLEKCYTTPPQCIVAYKYPETAERWLEEYRALLVDDGFYQPKEISLRLINHLQLDIFLKHQLSANASVREIIYFALHWFWKAAGAE